jgi:putative endonuclease
MVRGVRTARQRHGAAAEERVARYVADLGWRILDRNVKVGRDEIDLVALDPGPPAEVVCVEVRSASSAAFGPPEERVDRAKVGRLYRSMSGLVSDLRLPRRVDLVVVDARDGTPALRHLRRLEPR